jgi:hypothetical protein
VSKAVSRKLYLDDENGGSASRFFQSILSEDSLKDLVLYLTKLITREGSKVLTLGLNQQIEKEISKQGFCTTNE